MNQRFQPSQQQDTTSNGESISPDSVRRLSNSTRKTSLSRCNRRQWEEGYKRSLVRSNETDMFSTRLSRRHRPKHINWKELFAVPTPSRLGQKIRRTAVWLSSAIMKLLWQVLISALSEDPRSSRCNLCFYLPRRETLMWSHEQIPYPARSLR
jgi:hypothetical protein